MLYNYPSIFHVGVKANGVTFWPVKIPHLTILNDRIEHVSLGSLVYYECVGSKPCGGNKLSSLRVLSKAWRCHHITMMSYMTFTRHFFHTLLQIFEITLVDNSSLQHKLNSAESERPSGLYKGRQSQFWCHCFYF